MLTCGACGRKSADDARFCAACGAPLVPPTAARDERKVVTVFFCDLVGFTQRAEALDPEDVRALLAVYQERVRSELERFGGLVEKFIGDAVMALFGAPVAHDDDPERAVRAALAVRAQAQEAGDPQVRIGITTGEALVSLRARPHEGESMASGDVVNTAARLQAAAPRDGILVDETTYRATDQVIEYRPASAVTAKGKAEPIRVWEARQARSRPGIDVARFGRTPLVGREAELSLLTDLLARVEREHTPQLLTLVGVPGIGKSRLVYELFRQADARRDSVTWRQGRSLPYGDGISFAALSEIVRAQAGILETDAPDRAAARLRETVAAVVADEHDRKWVERHLRTLVGLETQAEPGADRRLEAFAAWRRFLEAVAETQTLILVFEDLHFADESLLDFVDHLADWASGVPLLLVATARPELLSRRGGWGGGKPNSSILSLTALTDEETAELVHALLKAAVLQADLRDALLERSGGNPLYAEEFARLLSQGRTPEELPETVQGLIAARIDGLRTEEKTLLQDASVLGNHFWSGGLATIATVDRRTVEVRLHDLERREFIRRVRRSSVAGDTEFAFRHVLVRDVAYGQIPRATRAEKHALAASWIESLGRPEEHAEVLAHHQLSSFRLAEAAGRPTSDLRERTLRALRDAGERAFALNAFPAADRLYSQALELSPPEDGGRPLLLLRAGHAGLLADDTRALERLAEAGARLLESGDRERAAEAEALLANVLQKQGQRDRALAHLERATELVESVSTPSPALARVLGEVGRQRMLADDLDEAASAGRRTLAIAEELGLEEFRASALNTIGMARVMSGDAAGRSDLELSLEVALAADSPEAVRSYVNLGALAYTAGDMPTSLALFREGARASERLGDAVSLHRSHGDLADLEFHAGHWNEARGRADRFLAEVEAGHPSYSEAWARTARALMRLAANDAPGALDDADRALAVARAVKDPQALVLVLAAAAFVNVELGRDDEADAQLSESLRAFGERAASRSRRD